MGDVDYNLLGSKPRWKIVTPAGYGKTHTIAESLKYVEGKQLILTHTHAGVASLREKIQNLGIPPENYVLETIDSFAQAYVKAFYCGDDVPDQENKAYFPFIIKKATKIFKSKPVGSVIKATYAGLYVDEYQDCSTNQHQLIMSLVCLGLPVRVLGDHLQGIFDFEDDPLVDFDVDLKEFDDFPPLEVPWRWKISGNEALGQSLKYIRCHLEKKESIDLSQYEDNISVIVVSDENDKYSPQTEYSKILWKLLSDSGDVLLLHPESANLQGRVNLHKRLGGGYYLLESVDYHGFYEAAKFIDDILDDPSYEKIYKLLTEISFKVTSRTEGVVLFNLTEVKSWIKETRVVSKRGENEIISNNLKTVIETFLESPSKSGLLDILLFFRKIPGIKISRKDLFYSLCQSLEQAGLEEISIYESMKKARDIKRRVGRKVKGKCIGTTLLTKGLECDTVVLLDAHKFNCPKNFYVAITRACKNLIIFTKTRILNPYI